MQLPSEGCLLFLDIDIATRTLNIVRKGVQLSYSVGQPVARAVTGYSYSLADAGLLPVTNHESELSSTPQQPRSHRNRDCFPDLREILVKCGDLKPVTDDRRTPVG